MFVSGGENIYPGEIEVEAASYPHIRACAVLAVDDTEWGKRPVLFVEPLKTVEFKEQDMAAYLKTKLPKIKIPEKIISLNRLPRAAIGKIDYAALRELYQKRYCNRSRVHGSEVQGSEVQGSEVHQKSEPLIREF